MCCLKHENTRRWLDFQLTSHLGFVCCIILSILVSFTELTVLISMVLFSSISYHKKHEIIGVSSYIDNVCATLLAIYGAYQLIKTPTYFLFCFEMFLALISVTTFMMGFLKRFSALYNIIHPIGMHIIPSIWAMLVICYNDRLFLNF